MRLIDADALLKTIFEHCRSEKEIINHFWYDENIIGIIANAPTIESSQSKWVISEIQCPKCLEYFNVDCYSREELNKCPNCGAEMKIEN